MIWLILVSPVEAARTPVLFPLAFAFATFVWTGLSAWLLGGWLCEDEG